MNCKIECFIEMRYLKLTAAFLGKHKKKEAEKKFYSNHNHCVKDIQRIHLEKHVLAITISKLFLHTRGRQ